MAWAYPGSRAALLLSRCVSWCAAVCPCIAVVTDIWRTESGQEERFTEPLAPGCRWPSVLGEEPARPPAIPGGRPVWPTHGPRSAGSRENPADIGVLPWAGAELCRLAVRRLICASTPGSRPRLPGPRMICRMQRPATDEPAPSWRCSASFRSADLLLTCEVPAVDLSCISRDGTR